ncbi:response regulator [Roseiconus lacunae]|uniref:Response regulator n=1 Tax=Roseiconus lacunae TaxID=2605694 RepID=A0ABT7PNB8_9BACT|nr:response regulator [Roseiconus lacunae]MCD0462124.1 response regulator [Roseiconus lacunae]MDM4018012.1 response regulator [Roseiconus lacunae]WRQ50713.1 response regulator [Stieleria sp. HD01]
MPDQLILIVDDEAQITSSVQLRLKSKGYATMTAENGAEGVRMAKQHHPNAILMDVRMPQMDGMQALRVLKDDAETADIPVIMLSASVADKRTTIDAGARFFVPKPFQFSRLHDAVKAIV